MNLPKKYQIFVSSTYRDLRNHRKALIEQILSAGHIPSGMEMFNAGNKEDFEVIKKAIDQADIFAVLIGARFGSVRNPLFQLDRRSYTQMEFEYARDQGKPILAFLLDEGEFQEARNAIKHQDEDFAYYDDLVRFRSDVVQIDDKRRRLVKWFSGKPEGIGHLKADFQVSLGDQIDDPDFEEPGWVRGSASEIRLPEIIAKNKLMQDIVARLGDYSVLAQRMATNPELKEGAARCFWDHYHAKLCDLEIHDLFFESGSSITALATDFERRLRTQAGRATLDAWRIKTNNIIAFLHFALNSKVRVTLTPYGPPETRYGATFGDIANLVEAPAPTENKALTHKEQEIVDKIAGQLLPRYATSLFLATTSALDLSLDSQFRGPHVGSYYNKLFKRAIFTANLPIVLFLDESKVPASFEVGHCHPVCGPGMEWERVCDSNPVAFCVGARTEGGRDHIADLLRPLGFDYRDPVGKYDGCWPLIVKNALFTKYLNEREQAVESASREQQPHHALEP